MRRQLHSKTQWYMKYDCIFYLTVDISEVYLTSFLWFVFYLEWMRYIAHRQITASAPLTGEENGTIASYKKTEPMTSAVPVEGSMLVKCANAGQMCECWSLNE